MRKLPGNETVGVLIGNIGFSVWFMAIDSVLVRQWWAAGDAMHSPMETQLGQAMWRRRVVQSVPGTGVGRESGSATGDPGSS